MREAEDGMRRNSYNGIKLNGRDIQTEYVMSMTVKAKI